MATKPKAPKPPKPRYVGANTDASLPIQQRLARTFVTQVRGAPASYYPKGKAALTVIALEFVRGAAIGINAITTDYEQRMAALVWLTSIRGYAYLEELADEPSPKEKVLATFDKAICREEEGVYYIDKWALTDELQLPAPELGLGPNEAEAWSNAVIKQFSPKT